MKLPRPSTRSLLLLVAVMGIALGLVAWMGRRAENFRSEASRHLEHWMVLLSGEGPSGLPRAGHHLSLARKYEEAARHPWLPVQADPPEPE